ncbi:MAG TPA: hypothetical protein VHE61_14790 [Opitutaceae bacterium]|nr:hypothetical protein [Opitutaceae bacterium]
MKPCNRRRFFILAPFFFLAFVGLFTSLVYWLWNSVLIDVVTVKAITFWQALGLLVLAKVLFGGFPGGRRGGFGPPWRRRMMERWDSLTPEQREEMREEMRRRFGEWPRPQCGGGGSV